MKYDNALEACDNIQTFKLVVKNVARRHGYHATFMPKPVPHINGSGMHTNLSLSKNGSNAFYDPKTNSQLSDTALKFISGVMKHAKEFTFISNPTVNSYKRLVPGYEAPVYISWSDANRSTMIRIPATRGKSTRIEVRSVDPSTNPYLCMSVLLASGLYGIKNNLETVNPIKKNLFKMSHRELRKNKIDHLPSDLNSAMINFTRSKLMLETIGDDLFNKLIEAKTSEWNEYITYVTDWEVKKYLNKI